MEDKFTEDETRELESQLSCPKGENGIEVAEAMNETNNGMISNSIKFLEIEDHNSVLELGHGNAKHLKQIFELAKEIKYMGLEISETMWKEAQKNNAQSNAEFELYDGNKIPFEDNLFDRIISVNTIYFWSNPDFLLNEIKRTLKPEGICVLAYADKEFMQTLSFVGNKFKLFDKNNIRKLMETAALNIIEFKDEIEQVKSNNGKKVERRYTMVKIGKSV